MEPATDIALSYGYKRDKGLKYLFRNDSLPPDAGIDPNNFVLGFPQILAVDTNCRYVGGSRVAISAVATLRPVAKNGKNELAAEAAYLYAFEMWNCTDQFERVGWDALISLIQARPKDFRWPMAIVTDHDVRAHQRINTYDEPYFEDKFLPKGASLVYGSSDGGMELLSNQMLRAVDRFAESIFKEESLLMTCTGIRKVKSPYFTHCRQWTCDDEVFLTSS